MVPLNGCAHAFEASLTSRAMLQGASSCSVLCSPAAFRQVHVDSSTHHTQHLPPPDRRTPAQSKPGVANCSEFQISTSISIPCIMSLLLPSSLRPSSPSLSPSLSPSPPLISSWSWY